MRCGICGLGVDPDTGHCPVHKATGPQWIPRDPPPPDVQVEFEARIVETRIGDDCLIVTVLMSGHEAIALRDKLNGAPL